jgi:hypothetical protein
MEFCTSSKNRLAKGQLALFIDPAERLAATNIDLDRLYRLRVGGVKLEA